jgi:hypothetical protein
MHERILNLYQQAEKIAVESADAGAERSFSNIVQEKFAELIVRECIETLRLVPYDSDREFGDEVIYQDAVKKHFGIKK